MNRQEAVHLVASWMAGQLQGGTLEEATGLSPTELEALSDAQAKRLDAARHEVIARLYRMGHRPAE